MTFIGIDFGSYAARLARIDSDGGAMMVPDYRRDDCLETRSVVHVGRECALVGQVAEDALLDAPDLPVVRAVGERLATSERLLIDGHGRAWDATALAALVLRKLARDAFSPGDRRLPRTVIAAPARFAADQHAALREAAMLAGLIDPMIVSDAVAIAAHELQGADRGKELCLIIDVGSSACTSTLVDARPELPVVIDACVARDCGGLAVDRIVTELVAAACGRAFAPAETRSAAWSPVDDLKAELCAGSAVIRRALLVGNRVREVCLLRRQFVHSLGPLHDACVDACARVLARAGIEWRDLEAVIVAGGSGALPGTREKLLATSSLAEERFHRADPLTAASLGAARLARSTSSLAGAAASSGPVARDIGVRVFDAEAGRSAVHVILKRDERLPAQRTATLYTSSPGQQQITVEVVHAAGETCEPMPLASFTFGPLVPRGRSQPIEVTLACDADGKLTATARDPQTDRLLAHRIDNPTQRAQARWRDLQALVDSVRINE